MYKDFIVYMHKTPSNKIYIGITSQNKINRRWQNGYGYRNNKHFFNAILKYGWDNIKHEILYTGLSKEDACKIEIELISKYKSNLIKYGYNQTIGGEKPYLGTKLSYETREKIRQAHLGMKRTKASIEKTRLGNLGKHCPEELKKILSDTRKGKGNPMYGKHTSDKQKEVVRRKFSKPIICIETKIIYPSIIEAERQTGICDSGIQAVCKKQRKTAGGYHWEYIEGDDIA